MVFDELGDDQLIELTKMVNCVPGNKPKCQSSAPLVYFIPSAQLIILVSKISLGSLIEGMLSTKDRRLLLLKMLDVGNDTTPWLRPRTAHAAKRNC